MSNLPATFLILMLGATKAPAQVVVCEGPEPNDRRVTATPMSCGDQAKGQIATGSDRDWYRFTVTGTWLVTGVMSAGTGCAGTGTAVAVVHLDLIDDRGVVLGTAVGIPGQRPYPSLQRVVTAGIYYFSVRVPGTQTGFYTLGVSCAPPTQITCGTPINGSIPAVNAFEFYTLTLASSADVTLAANSSGSALDTKIQLLNLGTHKVVLDSPAGPGTRNGTLLLRGLSAGTWLIGVTGEYGSTGSYRLDSGCAASTPRALPANGTVTDTLVGRHEAVFHSLSLTGVVDLLVSSDTPSVNNQLLAVGILDARGVPVGDPVPGAGCFPAAGPTVHQALPAGQFLVLVAAAQSTMLCPAIPTTYTLTAAGVPMAPVALSPGDPAPGSIATPGQFEAFRYTLQTPSQGWIMLNAPMAPNLDVYLTMFTGGGLYYGEDDDGGALRQDSLLDLWLQPDSYLLTARAYDPARTGSYEAIAGAETEIVGPGTVSSFLDLRWRGSASDLFIGFWSPGALAASPSPFPGQYFLLNPGRYFLMNAGSFPAGGIVEILQTPVDPSLVGATLSMQSLVVPANLDFSSVHLTNGDSIRFQ